MKSDKRLLGNDVNNKRSYRSIKNNQLETLNLEIAAKVLMFRSLLLVTRDVNTHLNVYIMIFFIQIALAFSIYGCNILVFVTSIDLVSF